MAGNGAKAKGTGMMSTSRWIRETYGDAGYKQLLSRLSHDAVAAFENPLATEWYPIAYIDQLWRALREERFDVNPVGFERAMREMGRFIANDNLSTVFRVLLVFVGNPEQMFRSLPKFWSQYFEGIEVELDESELDQRRGTTVVHNLGDLHHVSPVACGWIDFGLTKVGARFVRVSEEQYAAGKTAADPLTFRLSWS